MQMAYIKRPESNWLVAENIVSTEKKQRRRKLNIHTQSRLVFQSALFFIPIFLTTTNLFIGVQYSN